MARQPLTVEQKKERHRKYAHNHFLKTKCVFQKEAIERNSLSVEKKFPTLYYCWIYPKVGEGILIGPYKHKNAAMQKRMRLVRKLIAEGNARDFVIKGLELFEKGYFDDEPIDKYNDEQDN